jgi:hypothetical protein
MKTDDGTGKISTARVVSGDAGARPIITRDRLVELATDLEFEVTGHDEVCAAISGHGHKFFGTHAEVIAYLSAWRACVDVGARDLAARVTQGNGRPFVRTVISLCMSRSPNNRGQAVEVPPGESVQITTRPFSHPFRGERIAIPDYVAPHFSIDDVRVGNRSQLPQAGSIPASAFACRLSEQAVLELDARAARGVTVTLAEPAVVEFGRELCMETCQCSMDMVIVATNISSEPRQFEGFVVGVDLGV